MIIFFILLQYWVYSFEFDDVYSKIISDKFFRGVVADNLAEDINFVLDIGCQKDTYSEMRACIIDWIEKNPKKATELFLKKVKIDGEFKINSVIYEYYINPAFKDIIDKMQDAAKKNMSIENVRGISSFLFDANLSYEDLKTFYYDDTVVKSNTKQILNDFFKINTEALKNEISNINNLYYNLFNYKVKDLENIIKKVDECHQDFNNYFYMIKNTKFLDKNNVDKMFKKIENMKKMLILKTLIIRLRLAEEELNDENSFNKISKEILKLSKSELSFRDFLDLSKKIWHDIDNMAKLIEFIKRNEEIALRLNISYVCFLDYIFSLVDKFVAEKSYKNYENEISKLKDYFLSISFDDIKLKNYSNNYERATTFIQLSFRKAKKNRMIQYIIWDGFLPYDIYWLNKRSFLGLKIIQEGLFNYPYSKTIRGWNY